MHGEQVDSGRGAQVVAQEGGPALTSVWCPSALSGHELGDGGLADIEAKLEQLAVDPWRSPPHVVLGHLADQTFDLALDTGAPGWLGLRRSTATSSTCGSLRDATGAGCLAGPRAGRGHRAGHPIAW